MALVTACVYQYRVIRSPWPVFRFHRILFSFGGASHVRCPFSVLWTLLGCNRLFFAPFYSRSDLPRPWRPPVVGEIFTYYGVFMFVSTGVKSYGGHQFGS